MRLTDEQRLDWLRLIRSEKVGPRTFRALINQFGGAGAALEALPDLARRSGRPALRSPSRAEAEKEMARAARLGVRFVAMGEPEYPKALQAIDTAPPLIAVRGSPDVLARPARRHRGLAQCLGRRPHLHGAPGPRNSARPAIVVVSGLARGIDTRAHIRPTLETGTVAVLAGGHDRVYPAENEPLLRKIVEAGGRGSVSEMPIGWEPRGRDFPRRNRIVSGLSYGVVVVEAARRSGSLITARFALEQGREVFAVPGSPLDPARRGHERPHPRGRDPVRLDRPCDRGFWSRSSRPALGRTRTRRRRIGPVRRRSSGTSSTLGVAPPPSRVVSPHSAETVRAGGGTGPRSADQLVELLGSIAGRGRRSGASVGSAHSDRSQMTLLELELAGRLERHGGNAVSLLAGR